MTPKKHGFSERKPVPINEEQVLKRLKNLGFNRKELAKKAGMNYRSLINALKAGQISEYYLSQIAFALSVCPSYLMGETDCSFI